MRSQRRPAYITNLNVQIDKVTEVGLKGLGLSFLCLYLATRLWLSHFSGLGLLICRPSNTCLNSLSYRDFENKTGEKKTLWRREVLGIMYSAQFCCPSQVHESNAGKERNGFHGGELGFLLSPMRSVT